MHFGTLSSEIEQRKVVKKLIFLGAIILFAGSVNASLNIYICPKVLKKLGPICLQLFIFKSQRAYMLLDVLSGQSCKQNWWFRIRSLVYLMTNFIFKMCHWRKLLRINAGSPFALVHYKCLKGIKRRLSTLRLNSPWDWAANWVTDVRHPLFVGMIQQIWHPCGVEYLDNVSAT